jgi:hypothetical protein
MKELKKIYDYFEKKTNSIPRFDGDVLIVECKIQKDKYHSVMLILKEEFDDIILRVDYNSFLLNEVPILLENIKIKNLRELNKILRCSTKMHLCKIF